MSRVSPSPSFLILRTMLSKLMSDEEQIHALVVLVNISFKQRMRSSLLAERCLFDQSICFDSLHTSWFMITWITCKNNFSCIALKVVCEESVQLCVLALDKKFH